MSWRVTGENLVFDKLRPRQLTDTIAVSCFLAWDGDPSILQSFRLSCGFEPYPHVINSIMLEQEAYPQLKATLRGGPDSADED